MDGGGSCIIKHHGKSVTQLKIWKPAFYMIDNHEMDELQQEELTAFGDCWIGGAEGHNAWLPNVVDNN